MHEAGLESVTMVQRNKTMILPIEHYRMFTDKRYNRERSTELADREQFMLPMYVSSTMSSIGLNRLAATRPEFYEGLEKAGFKVDHEVKLLSTLVERSGGHYIDMGASGLIAAGKVSEVSSFALSVVLC